MSKTNGDTLNLYKHATTGFVCSSIRWIPSIAICLLYAHSGVMPNPIQLLTMCTHNTCLPRAYMGIHKQQEDEAWEKFWIRPWRWHSLEPGGETAPSTGLKCDWKTNTNLPPSYREGFVPNFKFQRISLSQQSLMSLLRTRPGELAVRGNYLCLPQHRTMLSFFFFFLQKILYLHILEGTLQHFASEIRVFSYAECRLSEQYTWKWSAWTQRFWTCWGPLD